MALHDDLTALPNRVLFGDRVEQGIRAAARMSEPLALLTLDLNGFKHVNDMLGHVNDMLGHQCGDLLLRLVAERLLGCLRDSDTIARLGGDEFGILPAGPTDLAGAAAIAWKVQQALAPTFVVRGVETEVTASIGIALLPDHGDNIDDLLRRADLAMYDAKHLGTGMQCLPPPKKRYRHVVSPCSTTYDDALPMMSSFCITSRRSIPTP